MVSDYYELQRRTQKVLILVLMEDGLGLSRWSFSTTRAQSLNPCFNGRWSRTDGCLRLDCPEDVLILVLMEDGLGPLGHLLKKSREETVLILVLMEDGLGLNR